MGFARMFASRSSITWTASGVWSAWGVPGRASANQITWFPARPSRFSIRLRDAND